MSETKMLKVWIPAAIYDAFHADAVKRFSKDSAWAREIILQHYGHIEGVESQVVGPGRPLGSGRKQEPDHQVRQAVQTPVYHASQEPVAPPVLHVDPTPPVQPVQVSQPGALRTPVGHIEDGLDEARVEPLADECAETELPVVPVAPAVPIKNPYLQRAAARLAGAQ